MKNFLKENWNYSIILLVIVFLLGIIIYSENKSQEKDNANYQDCISRTMQNDAIERSAIEWCFKMFEPII